MTVRLGAAILLLGVVGGLAFTFVRAGHSAADSLGGRTLHWHFALLCVVSMLCFAVVYAFCWALLLRALEERPLRRSRLMRLFLLTWPGRYLPASVAHYGGRFVAGPSVGAQRGAIAASFVYENLLTIGAAGAVSIALLLAHSHALLSGSAWAVAAVVAAAMALAALHPAVSGAGIRTMARRLRRLAPLEQRVLPVNVLMRAFAGYVLGALFAGIAFVFAVHALGEDVSPATAIAAYNLAGIAGMLAIAVPGGIGVREGVVVALLSGVLPAPVVLAAAVLARLAGIVADLLPMLFIVAFEAAHRLRTAHRIRAVAQTAHGDAA
jgi:uncharacterized membrane protein YbhN (UPF0104 family)